MKPAPFKYVAPQTVDEALSLLVEHGYDAKVLAGGQSLIPTMNFRLARPAVLIDLNNVAGLFYCRAEGGSLHLGAMTRQSVVEHHPQVKDRAPLMHETMPHVAHVQIRNRGTVGGTIAHADPAAELPGVMLALDAAFVLRSATAGERRVSAADFFTGMFMTTLAPEEILTEIVIPPLPARSGWAFREVARRHGDFALAGVAVMLSLDGSGCCRQARIGCISLGDGPLLAEQAAGMLIGQAHSEALVEACAETLAGSDIDPSDDIHAAAPYRRQLAKTLAKRAVDAAFRKALGSADG